MAGLYWLSLQQGQKERILCTTHPISALTLEDPPPPPPPSSCNFYLIYDGSRDNGGAAAGGGAGPQIVSGELLFLNNPPIPPTE